MSFIRMGCGLGVALFTTVLSAGENAPGASPHVFRAMDPVAPDDTVLVAGAGFGNGPTVELAHLERTDAGDPPGRLVWPTRSRTVRPAVVQPSDESLKFVVPASFPPGAWVFRVRRESGETSALVRLNCPTVYWSQGDIGKSAASPGGWLRVFGRCVARPPANPVLFLRQASGTRTLRLIAEGPDRWSLRAELPADIAPGRWRVWVHNGSGGPAGWTDAGVIQISLQKKWPDKVFNVRDFGAAGRGEVGDAVAVLSAIEAAGANGGGIVYFPRGQYAMQDTVSLPPKVVLRGEKQAWVSLFWPDTNDPYTLVEGTGRFGLEELTLYASNYVHAIKGATGPPDWGHVFLRRVRFRGDLYRGHLKPEQVDERFRRSLRLSSGGGDTVRLGGPGIVITDCDLYGSGRSLFLLHPQGAYVARNTFYNGRWGWYSISGSDGVIFEDNQIVGADLMSTGGGLNCLYGCTFSRDVYYARNRVRLCHGWDREAMTTDAGGAAYYGNVTRADGKRVILAAPGKFSIHGNWEGAGVFILGGTGMGQYREVRSVDKSGTTVTVDRPWDVPPDASSVITVTMMHRNYLFIGNRFEDSGIALQYYGTSIGHVAEGNTSERAGGFYNSGRWYHGFQPSWYCQFLDNRIIEGNGYRFGPNNATAAGDSFLGTLGAQRFENKYPLAYCTVHRGNHLENNALIRIRGIKPDAPGVRDVIIEHNTVENADTGLYVDKGCVGVWVRKNTFRNVTHPRFDAAAQEKQAAARRAAILEKRGPAARYTFDRLLGRLVPDESGNGFSGYAGRNVRFTQGVRGQALDLDGRGFVTVNDDAVLRFPQLTITAWVLPTESAGRWGIVAKRTSGTICPYVLAIRDNRPTFEATDTDGKWSYNLIGPPVVRPNQWNFIAVTVVEGKSVQLYCNGKPAGSKAVDKPIVTTNQPLTIGYEAWGGKPANPKHSGNFRGRIDEVAIWPRALSPAEIAAEFGKLAGAAREANARITAEAKARAERLKQLGHRVEHSLGISWKPVAIETFDKITALGPDWLTLRGKWTVANGRLHCDNTSFLALAKPIRLPVRIEFDCRSERPGDMTAFWGTRKDAYKGGYFVGFASNGNTANKLLRLGKEVKRTTQPLAKPGKWAHVIVHILDDGRIQLLVNGKPALEWRDPNPVLTGDTAGVLAWSEADFDNLVVFTAAQ
ncbi:MAG: hypothetical protein GXP31_12110 [Kiritimatiellaeota bacterium]|nr:hypothetical protein [Kiritimatiellota bacterium]